ISPVAPERYESPIIRPDVLNPRHTLPRLSSDRPTQGGAHNRQPRASKSRRVGTTIETPMASTRQTAAALLAAALAFNSGCQCGPGVEADGGQPFDAGAGDAGSIDAGVADAGARDAGSADAGAIDAGAADAGAIDAGTM